MREAGRLLLFAVAYVVVARLALSFAVVHGNATPVWPPTGLALALGLVWRRAWVAVLAGAFATVALRGDPLPVALGIALANTAEAWVGARLLRAWRLDLALARVQDVLLLAAVGVVVAPLLSTAGGIGTLWAWGLLETARVPQVALVWWVGNAMGALVVTPALLLLGRPWRAGRPGEGALLAVLTASVCYGVFGLLPPTLSSAHALVFTVFPLAVWAALRFGTQGSAAVTLFVSGAAIAGTARGLGPFAAEGLAQDLMVLQLFICVTGLTTLLLSAAVAERRAAAERLELLAQVVRDVREGVVVTELREDGHLSVVYANPAFCALVGRTPEELRGRNPRDLCAQKPDAETAARLQEALRTGGAFRGELVYGRSDGGRFVSDQQLSPVRDEDGRVTHFVASHRDVTEARALQAKLAAAERVAGVGTLVAGLGHEINNPLAYVTFSLASAVDKLESGSPREALERLRHAQEGAQTIRRIVRDLSVFTRDPSGEREVLELEALVEPVARMARHALEGRGQLVLETGPAPRVLGDEGRLGQVLLNLLVNAAQALPEGAPDRHTVHVRTGTDARGRALLEVRDDGCGMPPDVLQRAFEPFFTTKARGVGSGLGLPICQQIVQAHGGELVVESTPGHGTTVRVLLPAAAEAAQPPAPAAAVTPPWPVASPTGSPTARAASSEAAAAHEAQRHGAAHAGGADGAQSEASLAAGGAAGVLAQDTLPLRARPTPLPVARRGRVLVVDDEPRLAQSMRLLLEHAHEVATTTHGEEALAWMCEQGQHFDLVLCDLQMPGLSGMDLYNRLREAAPEQAARLIFISGGGMTPAARDFLARVPNRVLDKPVHPDVLLRVVGEALARAA